MREKYIHAPTQEIAFEILYTLHRAGYRWLTRDSLIDMDLWDTYGENTIYFIDYTSKTVTRYNIQYDPNRGDEITFHELDMFLKLELKSAFHQSNVIVEKNAWDNIFC